MHNSSIRDLFILFCLGGIVFVAGIFIVRKIKGSSIQVDYGISYEQEEKLGKVFEELFTKQFPAIKENAADSAIQQIANRLLLAIDTTFYHYKFTIIKSHEINAFTLPGGNIFIFSGLIEASESPEEVAAVLSHEIGHAENRHIIKKLAKDLSITVIVSILSGGDPSVITQILQQIIGNTFNREQEDEADQFGLELLEKASVNPINLALFFKHLNEKELTYNKNLEFLMTHPHNDSRIKKSEEYRTKHTFSEAPFEIDWNRVKMVIGDR